MTCILCMYVSCNAFLIDHFIMWKRIHYYYRVLRTDQRPGECSAVYGTMHDKEPLNSFNKSRE